MIGIIGALKIEVEALKKEMNRIEVHTVSRIDYYTGTLWGQEVVIAVCGIGKVNAAVCAQTMILSYAPHVIINTGVAGGIAAKVNIGDIVIAESVLQHDFVLPDAPEGTIGSIDCIYLRCSEPWIKKAVDAARRIESLSVVTGNIATGDQFMCDQVLISKKAQQFNAVAFEMEGGSIGQVCFINEVDFIVIRAISDNGDEAASVNFFEFVDIAAANALKLLKNLFSQL